jgi:hypothetical protein
MAGSSNETSHLLPGRDASLDNVFRFVRRPLLMAKRTDKNSQQDDTMFYRRADASRASS